MSTLPSAAAVTLISIPVASVVICSRLWTFQTRSCAKVHEFVANSVLAVQKRQRQKQKADSFFLLKVISIIDACSCSVFLCGHRILPRLGCNPIFLLLFFSVSVSLSVDKLLTTLSDLSPLCVQCWALLLTPTLTFTVK